MSYTLKDGKLTKVDEKDRQAAYSPSSPQSQAVKAKGGGKGSARDIEFADGGPSASQRKRILASQNDNSWGYHDMNTGKYVPAFIDMFDGGGKNTSGDTFQGAGLYSAALNAMNVAPYGYNRPRTYAQAGMENRPTGLPPSPPSTNTTNNFTANYVRPEVSASELPSANTYDLDPDAPQLMSVEELQRMINPLINNTQEGLLQQQYRPETVDPIQMIAMLRDQEMRRRNQPPTLLG